MARQHLQQAAKSVEESLHVWKDLDNQSDEAKSHSQLALIYRLLGELDQAEEHAHQAREIEEQLGLVRELWKAYHALAKIARARGDKTQAAKWEAKRDTILAEVERRAQGGGGFGV